MKALAARLRAWNLAMHERSVPNAWRTPTRWLPISSATDPLSEWISNGSWLSGCPGYACPRRALSLRSPHT